MGHLDSMNLNPIPPPPPPPSPEHPPPCPNNPDFTTPPRLKFPHFAGTNPQGWLFQAAQYFAYDNIRDHRQLSIASFHMDGAALAWFRWHQRSDPFLHWNNFVDRLQHKFGDQHFAGEFGSFSLVSHTSTVHQYIDNFEKLANSIHNLTQTQFL